MTNRSIIILSSIVILFAGLNCNSTQQKNRQLEGDLYFDWLRFGNFYNLPDSLINKFKHFADTVDRKALDSVDLNLLKMYEVLQKEDLLYQPFISLKLDNDSIIKIYFTNTDYNKFKMYKRSDLLDTKKKVRIKMNVRDLGFGMALSTKLITINKVDGQTYQINPKLKIEDYQ